MKPPNEVEVRTYRKPSRMHRRVAGVPLPVLTLIAIAGIVAAAVFLGPPSAVVTQTPKAIYAASATSGAEPAYGQIEPTLGYQAIDHVLINAWQAGYTAPQVIHVQVQIGGFASCAAASASLADINGVVGQVSLDTHPMPGTPSAILLSSGTYAGGLCVITTTATFSVTTAMTAGSPGLAFDMAFQYAVVPPGSVTWQFQAVV